MDSQLDNVKKLLELKVGDSGRLEELKLRLENHKILFMSDRNYLESLSKQYLSGKTIPTINFKSEKINSNPFNSESIKTDENKNLGEIENITSVDPLPESTDNEKKETTLETVPLENKEETKKFKFSFKNKKKEPKSSYINTELHWFMDKVEFRRQSKLAIAIGIITIIFSFSVFFTIPPNESYTGWNSSFFHMVAIIATIITWIVMILTGCVLISLGAREVPKYPSLANAIQDYINQKIKESKNIN